jgi:4-hydroxythreonine-4-phosphate dehydrogenase
MGDPSGIGSEVALAALRRPAVRRRLRAVLFGDASLPSGPWEVRTVTALPARDRRPGRPTVAGGRAQLAYFEALLEAARRGEVDALCTAPVSKEAISRTGAPFMGHTEVLGERLGGRPLMLMDGPRLKVALATTHVSIRELPALITEESVLAALVTLDADLRRSAGTRPRIAVCGLNPHAGEGGFGGDEERTAIAPAIRRARARGIRATGPWAADGLFAARPGGFDFDVALAMFHDQALVATKALDFAHTVNVTLGLPLPRTSPDHGVAYALAGRGVADAEPMACALMKAAQLASAASCTNTQYRAP